MSSRPRTSVRRKLAVATWRAPSEGRLHARVEVDATALLDYCRRQRAETGVAVSVTHVVGVAASRAVQQVPALHRRVVLGRVVPFTSYDVAFAVDVADGDDLAPMKVNDVDRKSVLDVARELEEGAARLRAYEDRAHRTGTRIAQVVPWFALRGLVKTASLLNGGLGVRAFGQPGHPLASLFVTNIGSLGLDEALVAPVPFARVPLYLCVGAVSDAPMVVDGQVAVRPRMILTATSDHRLVDGAHAARFAKILLPLLANPDLLDQPAT